jgi:hypothetical protein
VIMEPTTAQLKQMYRICQSLTQMYIPVYLITIDRRSKYLLILAGNDIEVTITLEGNVDYP